MKRWKYSAQRQAAQEPFNDINELTWLNCDFAVNNKLKCSKFLFVFLLLLVSDLLSVNSAKISDKEQVRGHLISDPFKALTVSHNEVQTEQEKDSHVFEGTKWKSERGFEPSLNLRSRQMETEFCDLSFIDENDRRKARQEYLIVNQTEEDVVLVEPADVPKGVLSILRPKRAAPKLRTIETAIFIDYYLSQKYVGKLSDLKRLVLATMNEVQLIYNYRTMKTPIKIVIVKFEVLQTTESGPSNGGGDIDKYLDNFCSWQARKHRTQAYETRWDHALMLTGLDLYKEASGGKKNKKVLGLAWVNGMCKPAYSCTLNEGKSFEAAFVIAHEMGHSLGILHDGRGNNCDPDKYLMSEKTGPGKVNWSPCSNKYLENFLTKGSGRCLDDAATPPTPDLDFQRVNRLPGEQYNPDAQCQLALGTQYKAYFSTKQPFNDVCRELWCISGSWATPAHPALEGSSCGQDEEKCFQGSCATRREPSQSKPAAAPGLIGSGVTVNRRSIPVNGNRNTNNRNTNNRNRSGSPRRSFSGILRIGEITIIVSNRTRRGRNSRRGGYFDPSTATLPAALVTVSPKPLMETFSSFIKSMIPEANKLFNFFSG